MYLLTLKISKRPKPLFFPSLNCPKKTLQDVAQFVLLLSIAQGNLNAGESVITVEGHDITLPGHHRYSSLLPSCPAPFFSYLLYITYVIIKSVFAHHYYYPISMSFLLTDYSFLMLALPLLLPVTHSISLLCSGNFGKTE
jgi:hypothetical protein